MIHRTLIGIGLAFVALCASAAPKGATKAVMISIDGLQHRYIKAAIDAGVASAPRGFAWMANGAAFSAEAYPVVTTLTAPSHVSTLTCSFPAQHGVIANTFMAGGQKLSGFNSEVKTETLVEAARRQGKTVISIAYVSVDGQNPRRTADFGVSYPDTKYVPQNDTQIWQWETLAPATGWVLRGGTTTALREAKLAIVLNPVTHERRELNALVEKTAAGYELTLDADKDLTNGVTITLTATAVVPPSTPVFFTEEAPESPLRGYRRRVDLRAAVDGTALKVFVAGSSYNYAQPESFRKWLDGQDLVWPTKFAVLEQKDPVGFVEEAAIVDRFLATVAQKAVAQYPNDLVLFYQPLIDTVEHAFEAKLPQPFNPKATDPISQAYAHAIAIVDANVSALLTAAGDDRTVMLMGDHGMEPMQKTLNLSAIMTVDRDKVDVVTSGSLALVYAKGTDPMATAAADHYGDLLAQALDKLSPLGKPSLSGQARKSVTSGDWNYGEAVWAFMAGEGLWFAWSLETDPVLPTKAFGMHGQSTFVKTMATGLFLKGPGVSAQNLGQISLIDAVPTLVDLLGIQAPRDCRGHSLLKSR